MPEGWSVSRLFASAAALLPLLLQGACSAGSSRSGYLLLSPSLQGPFVEKISAVYPGRLDDTNRYLPAVGVNTPAKQQDGESDCSGVLISPRLVLTAGHCVCLRRRILKEDRKKLRASVEKSIASQSRDVKAAVLNQILGAADSVIDGSNCAPLSTVTVIDYPSRAAAGANGDGGTEREDDDADLRYAGRLYKGNIIRPHEDLMIAYRDRTSVFKESDLAIIVLNRPVKGIPLAIRLASTPVQAGDRIAMVGYGFGRDGQEEKSYGNRHFAESRVLEVYGSDSLDVKFGAREEPGDGGIPSGVYGGDSGGPCFSKTDENVLVGIATGVTSENERQKISVFTSVFAHRKWVETVAREAGETVQ